MAVTSLIYGKAMLSLFNKEIDYVSDDIRAIMLTSAYTPAQDTHQYVSDVIASEIAGTGYTAGGLLLSGKTIAYDAGTNVVTLDCDDLAWTVTTLTNLRYIAIADTTPGTDATRPLIAYIDLGVNTSTSAQNFNYTVPSTGIAAGSVS